jgi:Surface antigen variable number repeat.
MNMSECSAAQTKNIEPNDSTKDVIEKVKDYSEEDNFFSRLVRKIFVQDNEIQPGNTILNADKKMIKKYTGKIIRKINVEVLDVFGASVDNPQDTVRSWLQDEGNSLHMKTKEWLIKNKLIFNEGQRLTPFDIQESERIIRQTSYVYDVRIIPQKIKNNADSVDIIVFTQDIWSINGSVLYHPGDKTGNVSFDDINFLGFGNDFKGGLKFDHQFKHGWDWDGSYSIDNIGKTFLSAHLYYLSDLYRQQYGVMIGRDFISPIINWAGAIAQDWQITRYPDLRNNIRAFRNCEV